MSWWSTPPRCRCSAWVPPPYLFGRVFCCRRFCIKRRLHGAAEGRLAQLDAAYNRLEDTEREKRAAGILKVCRTLLLVLLMMLLLLPLLLLLVVAVLMLLMMLFVVGVVIDGVVDVVAVTYEVQEDGGWGAGAARFACPPCLLIPSRSPVGTDFYHNEGGSVLGYRQRYGTNS